MRVAVLLIFYLSFSLQSQPQTVKKYQFVELYKEGIPTEIKN
ncbi:MAG: hypothetical protein ABR519_03785 [Bacteroidales bacterium]